MEENLQEIGVTNQLADWLARYREGDECARDAIIARACDRLRILASRMLRGRFNRLARWEQTDDVLQHALIRLHRSLADIRPDSVEKFMGLAAIQIRRTLIDLARHHFGPEGAASFHHSDGSPAEEEDHTLATHQRVQDGEEPGCLEAWAAFHEAVELLPDNEREVFNLVWYEGLSHAETASILNVNERTIRRRWQSARILLHQALGQPPE